MSIKIKFWCDNDANIHSCKEDEADLGYFGLDQEEWDEMTPEERKEYLDESVRDWAFEQFDWGYEIVEDD